MALSSLRTKDARPIGVPKILIPDVQETHGIPFSAAGPQQKQRVRHKHAQNTFSYIAYILTRLQFFLRKNHMVFHKKTPKNSWLKNVTNLCVNFFSDFLDLKPSDFISSIMKEIICEVCNYKPSSNHDLQKHCLTDSHLYKLGKKKCAVCHKVNDIKDLGEWGTMHVYRCSACIGIYEKGQRKCIYCGMVVPKEVLIAEGKDALTVNC